MRLLLRSCSIGTMALAFAVTATPALAQKAQADITINPMPLGKALEDIAAQSGQLIHYDPDGVAGHTSMPVRHAKSAIEAVRKAIRDTRLVVIVDKDGSLMIANNIVVVARRDEAETKVLINQTSTSDRNGQSLREQARNTEVISSKVISEQQSLNVLDALRNAGGVTVNMANVQGSGTYSVRGFSTSGLSNGLQGTTTTGVPSGTTTSVAAIERIEVLKGPDAILAGANNQGGVVNIVFKKPSADTLIQAQVDTGSYGLRRLTVDVNGALTRDQHLTARIIGVASGEDHNFGGYHGDEEYFIMPELRFKNATTDIVAGVAISKNINGMSPYTMLNPQTNEPLHLATSLPLFSSDQYISVNNTQIFTNITQKLADNIDLVVRYQHQHTSLLMNNYTVFALFSPDTALISTGQNTQAGTSDALDAYMRIKLKTAGVKHNLILGYNYLNGSTTAYSASDSSMYPYQFVGNSVAPDPISPVDTRDYSSGSSQNGYYIQDLIEFWKLHLSAAVRKTDYATYGYLYYRGKAATPNGKSATTPSFGAVLDVTKNISLFANYVRGFSPTLTTGYDGEKLPDNETRNIEGGVKIDLFSKKLMVTASYFNLRQSNILIPDPLHSGYSTPAPGQEGKGIDLNLAGTILPNWTIQANFTRTNYHNLDTTYGAVVRGVPKIAYNLFTTYERPIAADTFAGLSMGVHGRSRAAVDADGDYYVPSALQVDANAMIKWRRLTINLGVRNLFDRLNYGISYTATYIPYQEPRNVRLTIGYRFK